MSKMAHVTVTRTTTTTTTSAILINSGYMKSFPGLLKLAELILGAVAVGLVAYYYDNYYYQQTAKTFFLLMATTFLIGTFCLYLSCVISLATSSIISKTIYEVVYHMVAFGLYVAASIALLAQLEKRNSKIYDAYMAASIIGLVVSGLYLFSAILAIRSYRGL